MSTPALNERIKDFYDESTQLWLDTWGEHMHHGHYGPDGKASKDRYEAQIDLIEELLEWGQVDRASRILDAGCGVGGSSRYLARKYKATALGLTLSPVQAKAGTAITEKAGLADSVKIEVRDMMTLDHPEGSFDLVYSMESAEHIEQKQALLNKFFHVLGPDGRMVMATWCHRNTPPELKESEEKTLESLYRIYNLPPMCSEEELRAMAENAGFEAVETADWSAAVAPFWKEVIKSALVLKNLKRLLATGWSTLKGAWAMRYMQKGFRKGFIRFIVLRAKK